MAVTQQLARLTADELEACRTSVAQIDALCSFRLRPDGDHLDLGWAPGAIMRAAEVSGLPGEVTRAIRAAVEGDGEVNPAYRDAPDSVWEHPVAGLAVERVREVADVLERVSLVDLFRGVDPDPDAAARQLGYEGFSGSITAWASREFSLLSTFYRRAADRRLCVAVWWD